jgi:hypothetical protein
MYIDIYLCMCIYTYISYVYISIYLFKYLYVYICIGLMDSNTLKKVSLEGNDFLRGIFISMYV